MITEKAKDKMFVVLNKNLPLHLHIVNSGSCQFRIAQKLVTYPDIEDLSTRWMGDVILRELKNNKDINKLQLTFFENFWKKESKKKIYGSND